MVRVARLKVAKNFGTTDGDTVDNNESKECEELVRTKKQHLHVSGGVHVAKDDLHVGAKHVQIHSR